MRSRSYRQEKRLAEVLGGRKTPVSGAFWHSKGDVKSGDYLVEAKTTEKASYSVKRETWERIRSEALLSGRVPVLALQIQDRNLIVLDEEDFVALLRERPSEDMGERGMS